MRTLPLTAITAKIAPVAVAVGLGCMAGVGITDAWGAHQRHSHRRGSPDAENAGPANADVSNRWQRTGHGGVSHDWL